MRQKGRGKKIKNQNLSALLQGKNSLSEHDLILSEHHDKPPSGDQGLAFQTHALQMILFEPSLRTSPILSWSCYESCPYKNKCQFRTTNFLKINDDIKPNIS